jgi:serine/threonine-protein kinase
MAPASGVAPVPRLSIVPCGSIASPGGADSQVAHHTHHGTTRTLRPRTTLPTGATIANYRIEHLIGVGGMGEVYKGFDLALDRPVAIKAMRRELLSSPLAVRRFQREAQALARINCTNVTQIYGFYLDADPAVLVMELVDGPSLLELLKERGVIAPADVSDIALQTVRGLEVVYGKGLIHRDVNPKNVLLDSTGTVKLTDFGMVKMELSGAAISRTAAVVGTPLYISPEQARGQDVDFRTDLYALGLTMFHLLAGRPPFTGSTVGEVLTKQIMEPLPAIEPLCPGIPAALAKLVARLGAKAAADRPSSHAQVVQELTQIVEEIDRGRSIRAAG